MILKKAILNLVSHREPLGKMSQKTGVAPFAAWVKTNSRKWRKVSIALFIGRKHWQEANLKLYDESRCAGIP